MQYGVLGCLCKRLFCHVHLCLVHLPLTRAQCALTARTHSAAQRRALGDGAHAWHHHDAGVVGARGAGVGGGGEGLRVECSVCLPLP
jgi:hypothetical protein